MDTLLTTKQLQEYLKVDRTTIYRMLREGRLVGIRVGGQWRFSREATEAHLAAPVVTAGPATEPQPSPLPLAYLQPIQDVFSDIAQVGSLTTAPDGTALTRMSNTCRFCALILASESGRQACTESWRKLAEQPDTRPQFVKCHAGLLYARARIESQGRLHAMVIAGQFHSDPPAKEEQELQINRLAQQHTIDPDALRNAAADIPIIDHRMAAQIGTWLQKIARTFERLGQERLDLMGRLRKIAAMTDVHQ